MRILFVMLLLVSLSLHANEEANLYGQLPLYRDISLSPDGSKAVALRAIGDTYQVVFWDFVAGKSGLLMAADPEIQLELQKINEEFAITEMDGLEFS